MNKFSQYNIRANISEKTDIIYNSVTNKFVAIRHDITLENLESISPSLFTLLQSSGMILTEDIEERENVIHIWNSTTSAKDSLTLIINPTLRCNFNCWYCYETHKNKAAMSNDILDKVKDYIARNAQNINLLKLSFFGGEPLLEFNQIVKPLIEYAESTMQKNNKGIQISFTTNGYLLTKPIIDYLSLHNTRFMQITLDGGRKTHNRTRVSKIKDSFDTITENIKQLLEKGIGVTLRINVTPDNIDECRDVVSWIGNLPETSKRRLTVNVQQVWQTRVEPVLTEKIDLLIDSICEMGVYAYPAILDNLRYMCYADKRNTIVVNSDGRIFKCTAVDFESTNGESHISTPHLEEDLKRNFQLIQKKRFSNKRCLDCEIFPLCLGGCLKIVKYNKEKDYCIYDNDSDLKKRLVMTIIKDRIRRNVIPDYNK